jgi:CheY-like chemotaxis protein
MSRIQCDIRRLLSHLSRAILEGDGVARDVKHRLDHPLPASTSGAGVLIVHHEEQARRATRAVVNAAPGFDVVGEAASAEEALELAVALRPNLALIGVSMPGIDGFETSRRLVAALPTSTVVLLFTSVEPSTDTVVGSQAVAAVHHQALTPASLRALWSEHRATGDVTSRRGRG